MSERIKWNLSKRPSRSGAARRRVAGFVLAYRLPGMPKVRYRTFSVRERSTAVAMAAEFRRQLERESVTGSDVQSLKRAAVRAFSDHVADFVAVVQARNRDSMYCYNLEKLLTRLANECGWSLLADISSDSVLSWRRASKLKPKSIKGYLDALWAFCKWLVDQGRLGRLPVRREDVQVKLDGESAFRAFTDAECLRLLSVAPVRRAVYLFAMLTGLRRAEIDALLWHDLRLDLAEPFVAVRSSTTKNAKLAAIPLRDDLVAELKRLRPGDAEPADRVFPDRCPSMEVFRSDLASAGIVEVDAAGRRAVFHSLRHTLATNLLRANVPTYEAMRVMRHSDAKLLHRIYADPSAFMSSGSVAKLPRFDAVFAVGAAVGSPLTGTDRKPQPVSSDVTKVDSALQEKSPDFSGDLSHSGVPCSDLSSDGTNWGTRIRT